MTKKSIDFLQYLVKNEIDRLQGKMEIEHKIFTDLGVKNLDDTQYKKKFSELEEIGRELEELSNAT